MTLEKRIASSNFRSESQCGVCSGMHSFGILRPLGQKSHPARGWIRKIKCGEEFCDRTRSYQSIKQAGGCSFGGESQRCGTALPVLPECAILPGSGRVYATSVASIILKRCGSCHLAPTNDSSLSGETRTLAAPQRRWHLRSFHCSKDLFIFRIIPYSVIWGAS
ncbi:uncharacterized protein BDR25DRAFT_34485 [Lindgomyces ingoldianus]|uniref:Uncharacterized protein n=1 Tax=Lindgomyces ingoldianus TaxID=673940 RepID=A0ACB6QWF1_9PLEO|nr:uncharacterized protein BDR25DRAFT_34485 [Lindgomyces ingoldianus]KAF2470405.1 hypothetical protein BDR25DRAFT_34485 [Lindgomyces ingoldianus]